MDIDSILAFETCSKTDSDSHNIRMEVGWIITSDFRPEKESDRFG